MNSSFDNIFSLNSTTHDGSLLEGKNATSSDDDDPFENYADWYNGAFAFDCYTLSHQQAEAILMKATAGLSMLGSLVIMTEIIKDHRMKKGKVLNRILLNLSVADLISSFAWFLSSWPTPEDDEGFYEKHTVYNVGSQAACTFQGFMAEFGTMASVFIMVVLAWCYLLTLKYGWTDEKLKSFEKIAYPIVWIPALAWALIPIPLEMYNNRYYVCQIEPYPTACWESWTLKSWQVPDCIRGDNATLVRLIKMAIIWTCILVVLVLFVLTICAILKTERRTARWDHPVPPTEEATPQQRRFVQRRFSSSLSTSPSSSAALAATSSRSVATRRSSPLTLRHPARTNRSYWRTRLIAKQCIFYISAYVITWVPRTIMQVLIVLDHRGDWGQYFDTVASAILTMQGFWNFLIFLEKRKMKTIIGGCLKSIFCCCFSCTTINWCWKRKEDGGRRIDEEGEALSDDDSSCEDEEASNKEKTELGNPNHEGGIQLGIVS